MLILTRRIGESIRVGDDVSVTVLGVKGSQVRIGIDAPKYVPVHREEVYNRIQESKQGKNRQNHDEVSSYPEGEEQVRIYWKSFLFFFVAAG